MIGNASFTFELSTKLWISRCVSPVEKQKASLHNQIHRLAYNRCISCCEFAALIIPEPSPASERVPI
jgi:hypothetical protein